MSNTPNPNEIDEVMSSVRKLVSRGERSAEMAGADDMPPDPESGAEKLLLTPALRVDDPNKEGVDPPVADNGVNVLILDPEKANHDATVAQLEAAVAEPVEDWQPEETDAFDEADWAVSAVAASEATQFFDVMEGADPAKEQADAAPAPADDLTAFLPQEPSVDPDMLREMIVQIVREELAGDTGERITRNVRKLVRREINLMLAARNLR